ncbi:hypothetical protein BGX38DRAFT_1177074 [Terfezia claveryi]|nr:hypothetical protein BGX38DRAFT_1177074 [Terfezia claveryi]
MMARRTINDATSTMHTIFRIIQILTLIPAWAILAAVIANYNDINAKTPGAILFLFVVAILASVWAFCVLVTFLRAHNTALWMTFFDVVAMALLIAAVVVVMNNFHNVGCIDDGEVVITPQYYPTAADEDWWNAQIPSRYRDHCGKVKAAWGLAIANIIFFFITAFLTAIIYIQNQPPLVVREEVVVEQPSLRPVYSQPSTAPPPPPPPPPPVFQEPYYGPPRRHSRGNQSHRSHSHRSRHGGSYYEGSRRSSQGPDYYA